ncbi:MAG: DinB family protein [Bacteroidota bacterium]
MKTLASQLGIRIDQYAAALKLLPGNELSFKPVPGKWSKKEIIGHLADSAQSNIRRFIIAQYEDTPVIVYNQDKWVSIVNYQQWNSNELIDLWYLLNKQVCAILSNTSAEMAQRKCQTQAIHTIEWLAQDYVKHLRHHIHQVLQWEPVPYT